MKKIMLTVLAIMLMATPCLAADPIAAYQFTISWPPVTQNLMNQDIPAGQITYDIYLVDKIANPSKQNVGPYDIILSSITGNAATVTLTKEGTFFVGVEAVRKLNSETVSRSGITWMDADPANPSAIVHYSVKKVTKVTVVK